MSQELAPDSAAANTDPAHPTTTGTADSNADLLAQVALTNYGDPAANEGVDEDMEFASDTTPELAINIEQASNFLNSCMTASPRVKYGLGAKVNPHGAVPGSGFTKVDCSGFVRETIWRAASHFNFPDGSVVQHDWIKAKGYQKVPREEALLQDGKVRIVFLRPQDSPSGIGHVALVHNAQTLESHGGVGPNHRDWTGSGWQGKAFVYVLKN